MSNERDQEEKAPVERPLTLRVYFERMGWGWPPPKPMTQEAEKWIDERMKTPGP